LDVLVNEMQGLSGSVTQDELDRAKTNLKAALVMGEESPGSRASSNVTDWWFLGRVRPLSEISAEIDRVTIDSVYEFLARYPFRPASLLTLGKNELAVPTGLIGGGR
jgi:predicted Zn-dependent peptidase